MIEEILSSCLSGKLPSKANLCELLSTAVGSMDYYHTLATANLYARRTFSNIGLIFGQIGIDRQPCHIDCKFCSLAKSVIKAQPVLIHTKEETVQKAVELVNSGADDIFLMTTAEFSPNRFLDYGKAVRRALPSYVRMVVNIGDFDLAYAKKLKSTGFTGAYHLCRLREGKDTGTTTLARTRSMDAVAEAGMELYYCVEPIGPEHSNNELIEEMLRPRGYPVGVMAVMKRTAVPGTPLYSRGECSAARLAQICAVTLLAMQPKRAMGVHEPDELCLMAGANQLYAEYGCNPRDTAEETSISRGFSVEEARILLKKCEWDQSI